MAATGWTYFVPFQQDVELALQDLRRDVFSRRAYTLPGDLLDGISDESIAASMGPLGNLRKMLGVSKALDEAMKRLGADTTSAEKDSRDLERFIQRAEKEGMSKAARQVLGAGRKKAPKSIEQARAIAGVSGTHSILDIEATSTFGRFGVATSLSRDELLTIFGTETPSRDAVREKEKDGVLTNLREPGEAAFFVVFDGGTPSEIVFCGHSGD